MRPLFSSVSITFLHFPPNMQPMTFHLLFLLISIIFMNKCAKNAIFPFQILSHFLSHKKPNEHPLGCPTEDFTSNKCPIHPWLLFLTFIT